MLQLSEYQQIPSLICNRQGLVCGGKVVVFGFSGFCIPTTQRHLDYIYETNKMMHFCVKT